MTQSTLVTLLEAWREAERALSNLGDDDPMRPAAERAVAALRAEYAEASRTAGDGFGTSYGAYAPGGGTRIQVDEADRA